MSGFTGHTWTHGLDTEEHQAYVTRVTTGYPTLLAPECARIGIKTRHRYQGEESRAFDRSFEMEIFVNALRRVSRAAHIGRLFRYFGLASTTPYLESGCNSLDD